MATRMARPAEVDLFKVIDAELGLRELHLRHALAVANASPSVDVGDVFAGVEERAQLLTDLDALNRAKATHEASLLPLYIAHVMQVHGERARTVGGLLSPEAGAP